MELVVNSHSYTIRFHHQCHKQQRLTNCEVASPTRGVLLVTTAKCNLLDQFNRSMGRKVALAKAIIALFPTNKEKRRALWGAYWAQRRLVTAQEWRA